MAGKDKESGVFVTPEALVPEVRRKLRTSELKFRARELGQVVSGLREANDKLARSLGVMVVGHVRTEAVASSDGQVAIKVDGKLRQVFDTRAGLGEAKAAARRAFERLANKELTKPRTMSELKETVVFDGATLSDAMGQGLRVMTPKLELVDE